MSEHEQIGGVTVAKYSVKDLLLPMTRIPTAEIHILNAGEGVIYYPNDRTEKVQETHGFHGHSSMTAAVLLYRNRGLLVGRPDKIKRFENTSSLHEGVGRVELDEEVILVTVGHDVDQAKWRTHKVYQKMLRTLN